MPVYSVRLNVNVPGPGDINVVQNNIGAPSMEAAIAIAKANIIIVTLAAQQTNANP